MADLHRLNSIWICLCWLKSMSWFKLPFKILPFNQLSSYSCPSSVNGQIPLRRRLAGRPGTPDTTFENKNWKQNWKIKNWNDTNFRFVYCILSTSNKYKLHLEAFTLCALDSNLKSRKQLFSVTYWTKQHTDTNGLRNHIWYLLEALKNIDWWSHHRQLESKFWREIMDWWVRYLLSSLNKSTGILGFNSMIQLST